MKWVFWNGKIVPSETVLIPFENRGFLFGEGIFTTIRIKEGTPQFLEPHLERFFIQSNALELPQPRISKNEIFELINLHNAHEGNFRLKLIQTHDQEIASIDPYTYREGYPYRLAKMNGFCGHVVANLKSLSYLERRLAKKKGLERGFDDSILICPEGLWLETGSGNLFWREKGVFFYPAKTELYLKGIILNHLIPSLKMEPTFLNPSSEAHLFFCNSLQGVCPVIEVEGIPYPRDLNLEKEAFVLVK